VGARLRAPVAVYIGAAVFIHIHDLVARIWHCLSGLSEQHNDQEVT